MTKKESSWQKVAEWYDKIVGPEGHYYHREIIFPKLSEIIEFKEDQQSKVLDLACGQGILEKHLPAYVDYLGVDAAKDLIASAKKERLSPSHEFMVADVTKPLSIENDFTHAFVILAIQNMDPIEGLLKNCAHALKKDGELVIVMNHPCFRIPRQTSWEIDEQNDMQYRRVNRYMSLQKIPIQMQPSKQKRSAETLSFHRPLSFYFEKLQHFGFAVTYLDEWISNKESYGKAAKRENRARNEFPLFLTLIATKF